MGATSWERPHWKPGGGDAFLSWTLFGDFAAAPAISGSKYRTRGLPEGVEARVFDCARERILEETLEGYLGRILDTTHEKIARAVREAPQRMVLQGTVQDPGTLDYLRDAIGVATAFLDAGALALLHTQGFLWFDRATWRREVFEPDAPRPSRLVQILVSPERNGKGEWFHTRGLRTFGRPELSFHHVTPARRDAVVECFNRFIEGQAAGLVIEEGAPIKMKALPPGLVCHHAGNLDDPDFNNVHVEIAAPRS